MNPTTIPKINLPALVYIVVRTIEVGMEQWIINIRDEMAESEGRPHIPFECIPGINLTRALLAERAKHL
jgi:hypothetical protein